MSIGEKITNLRKRLKLKQGDMAKMCKMSQSMLSRIEKGYKDPTIKMLQNIANVTDSVLLVQFVDRTEIE